MAGKSGGKGAKLGDPTVVITEENLTPTPVTPPVIENGRIVKHAIAKEGFHTVSGPQYLGTPVGDRSHDSLNKTLQDYDEGYYTDELLQQLTLNDKLFAVSQLPEEEEEA